MIYFMLIKLQPLSLAEASHFIGAFDFNLSVATILGCRCLMSPCASWRLTFSLKKFWLARAQFIWLVNLFGTVLGTKVRLGQFRKQWILSKSIVSFLRIRLDIGNVLSKNDQMWLYFYLVELSIESLLWQLLSKAIARAQRACEFNLLMLAVLLVVS